MLYPCSNSEANTWLQWMIKLLSGSYKFIPNFFLGHNVASYITVPNFWCLALTNHNPHPNCNMLNLELSNHMSFILFTNQSTLTKTETMELSGPANLHMGKWPRSYSYFGSGCITVEEVNHLLCNENYLSINHICSAL